MRSSHVAEDGGMTLAPLMNTQETSYRQNARGYDTPSRMGQRLRKCQDRVKWLNVPSAIRETPCGWHRRNLELFAIPSQCQGKVNALGDANMRRPRRRQGRRRRRRQHETLRVSPIQVSAVSPPRYPQVGKTVEGDKIEEVETSY